MAFLSYLVSGSARGISRGCLTLSLLAACVPILSGCGGDDSEKRSASGAAFAPFSISCANGARASLPGGPPSLTDVAFSPDGRTVAVADMGNCLSLWDVESRKLVGELMLHGSRVSSVCFSPCGSRLVSTASRNVCVWDAATQKEVGASVTHKGTPDSAYCGGGVTYACFSPDGRLIASSSHDDTVILWDAATMKPMGEPLLHPGNVQYVCFSPDGSKFATACDDGGVRLWDTQTRQQIGSTMKHERWVVAVSFSPCGSKLASACFDRALRLWDVATQQPLGKPMQMESPVDSARFSPDGRLIACASGEEVVVWEVDSQQQACAPLKHDDFCSRATFSPDGRMIVSVGADAAIRFWPVPQE